LEIIIPANIRFPLERAGGIQIVNLAHCFAKNRADVTLLVRRMNSEPLHKKLGFYGLNTLENLKILELPVLNTRRLPKLWNLSYVVESFLYLLLSRCSGLTYIYTRAGGSYLRLLELIRRLKNVHIAVEIHENILSYKDRDYQLLARADKLIAKTDAIRQKIVDRLPEMEDKVIVAHSGFNFKNLDCPDYCLRGDGVVNITYIGGIYRTKGVETLARAFAKACKKTSKKLTLSFVGGLPWAEDYEQRIWLEGILEEEGIARTTMITGFVEPYKLSEYYSSADILVLPTPNLYNWDVSSPVKLFEYMASGRPIIASELAGINEIVHDDEVMYFPPNNEEGLCSAICRLAEDDGLRLQMARNGLKEKAEVYSFEVRAKRILEFLKDS